jgi:hypothetical protein
VDDDAEQADERGVGIGPDNVSAWIETLKSIKRRNRHGPGVDLDPADGPWPAGVRVPSTARLPRSGPLDERRAPRQ